MSVLALAILAEDLAVVAVDTLTTRGREASKLLPLPHIGAVVAGRGNVAVLGEAVYLLNAASTFEEGVRGLGEILTRAVASVERRLQDYGVDPSTVDLSEQQLALVGVNAEGRMAAAVAERNGTAVAVTHDVQAFVAPAVGNDQALLLLATDIGARLLAYEQVQVAKAAGHEAGFGGRCIVARITATPQVQIGIKDLGPLG